MEQVTLDTVHKDLEDLKVAVTAMQEIISDSFLTAEEEENLETAREEFEKGETVSLETLELERKNAQS